MPRARKSIAQQKEIADKKTAKKNLQAFKTALPLVIAFLLLGLVYWLFIVPAKPDNQLKEVLTNTFEPGKITSGRFDGKFGDKETKDVVEYSGQFDGNGNTSFTAKFTVAEQTMDFDFVYKDSVNYMRVKDAKNMTAMAERVPAFNNIDSSARSLLVSADDKWLSFSNANSSMVSSTLQCKDELGGLTFTKEEFTSEIKAFPIDIISGPTNSGGDENIALYYVKVKPEVMSKPSTALENRLLSAVSCIGKLMPKKIDQVPAPASAGDQVIAVSADSTARRITQLDWKAGKEYFTINFRDLNRDVSIVEPDSPTNIIDFVRTLPADQQQQLLTAIGL